MKNLLSTKSLFTLLLTLALSFAYANATEYCPPYEIPVIKTEADFTNKVYIDPSRSSNGNGTISSPHNTLQGISIRSNTVYFIRRGTVLNERVTKKWNNNMVTAYGDGAKPIINGGLLIQSDSRHTTFLDLDIRSDNHSGGRSAIIDFERSPISTDITIAYCNVQGVNNRGRGFPYYVLHHGADNMIVYHNILSHCTNNGWWLGSYANVKIVRNWIHKTNLDGENKNDNSGDGIQAIYRNHRLYIAGNIIDKSNAIWKYALMLNKAEQYASDNMIVEYNTLIAPRSGNGGAALFWRPRGGKNNVFRKNIINSHSHDGRTSLVTPIHTELDQLTVSSPYGIRDNHILVPSGRNITFPSSIQGNLHSSNRIFHTMSSYSTFLRDNPNIGLYGSDIDVKNFWAPICKQVAEAPKTFEVTFDVNCFHGTKIDNAVINFNGQSNPEGNYSFSNVPAGNYEYSISAPGHLEKSVTGHEVNSDATISVVMETIPDDENPDDETPLLYTVNFNITNLQGIKIQNAIVTFNGKTNIEGIYSFEDITSGTYTYTVSAQNYQTVNISGLVISQNMTIPVQLTASQHQITLTATPEDGGVVSGQGAYNSGDIVTISAQPIDQFKFLHWRENGSIISTQPTFTFIADGNRNIEANFAEKINMVVIKTEVQPHGVAFVTGAGTYNQGDIVYLTAASIDASYVFAGWEENGKLVSRFADFSFVANTDRELRAIFLHVPQEFKVNANINLRGAGIINGNGKYLKGSVVELSVVAEKDVQFLGWENTEGRIVSRQNPFVFEVQSDVELNALVVKNEPTTEPLARVYPNPSNGRFTIEIENNSELTIHSSSGMMVRELTITSGANQIDISDLPVGMYILTMHSREKVFSEKIIIR